MNKLRLPGLVTALALIGCGATTTDTVKDVSADRCATQSIDCHDPTNAITCDPADGVCKCGGQYGNGIVCGADESCVIDDVVTSASPSCVSTRCEGAVCGRYEVCDPRDGLCKCNGVECASGFTCLAGVCVDQTPCDGVTCREGEVCDPVDRICKCGDGICSMGETCRAGDDGWSYCVGRRCVGMNCPAGTECSPIDGLCHCGSASGPACTAGQACLVDTGTGKGFCDGDDICESVVCHSGTACSPLDGECRCGGLDSAAPICDQDQTCDQANRRCLGGRLCAEVECVPGSNLSCDDEDGICKCGGLGGLACEDDEGCVAGVDVPLPLCVKRCDPLQLEAEDACGAGMGCYFGPANRIAFCAIPGRAIVGGSCELVTDCPSGHHCVSTANSSGGVCRPYCDIKASSGDNNACDSAGTACVGLSGTDGVVPSLGVCMNVSL